jgi:GNAT superfamily N-acetyltransferase
MDSPETQLALAMELRPFFKIEDKSAYVMTAYANHPKMGPKEVGAVMLVEHPNLFRMMGLMVAPAVRRDKVGTRLVQAASDYCDQKKKPIWIERDSFLTDPQQPAGMTDEQLLSFYTKLGFEQVTGHPFAMVRFPVAIVENPVNN